MHFIKAWLSVAVVCALLAIPALAEELWVRNQPFKGQVQGSGPSMMVELDPLVKALELDVTVEGDSVVFGDFSVPIQRQGDGTGMVNLTEIAGPAGLKIKRNPTLGTVDVYAASVGTGSRGDWAAVEAKQSAKTSSGSGKKHEGYGYTIRIPASLEMTDDPALLALLKQYVGGGQALAGAEFEFVVQPKNGSKDAAMLMMSIRTPNFTEAEAPALEKAMAEGFAEGVGSDGGRVVEPPTPISLGGDRFYKTVHVENQDGKMKKMESYLHLSSAQKKAFILMFGDEEKSFNATAAKLRPAAMSLRIKK